MALSGALYYGDNLDVLRRYVEDESADLVYLDPPFNSNASYNVLFAEQDGSRSAAQIKAFEDTWRWDQAAAAAYEETVESGGRASQAMRAFRTVLGDSNMLAYLAMMAPRLIELRRVLKRTGSLYLHCDPTASHYLKLLLDATFGPKQFRSEIIWRRSNAHNKVTTQYGPIHDALLFYSKTDTFTFHPGVRPYTKAYIEDRFKSHDTHGRYQLNYLTGPGTRKGASGVAWRGFDPTKAGRHWAIPASLRPFLPDRGAGMTTKAQLEALLAKDLIVFPKKAGGQPMYKQYVGSGVPYQDVWAYQANTRGVLFESDENIDEDVKWLEAEDEKLGFETQKPVGLLKRIIETSSDEGDVVLDPFCGCGTTIQAAQELGRRWIGIDITYLATHLIKSRLVDAFGEGVEFDVTGEPTTREDAAKLAEEDRYQFEAWALGLVGARTVDKKKGADVGIDGRLLFHEKHGGKTRQAIISVKSGHVGVDQVRVLRNVVEREEAELGLFISLSKPTQPMRAEAASAGVYRSGSEGVGTWGQHPKIQLLTIQELLEGKRPDMPPLAGSLTFPRTIKAEREIEPGRLFRH
jgi:DNA modification methylase